jgi:hypothetical protein
MALHPGVDAVPVPSTTMHGFRSGVMWPRCAYWPVIPDHGFRHLAEQADATPQIRLDDYVARTGIVPGAITIDVEGAEYAVLEGARHTLDAHRPMVWASLHTRPGANFLGDYFGKTEADLKDLMKAAGYRRRYLCTDHEVHYMFMPDETATFEETE